MQALYPALGIAVEETVIAGPAKTFYALQRIRGFHRIRHYGLIANAGRRDNLARVRDLLNVPPDIDDKASTGDAATDLVQPTYVCPDCGAPMIIIETFASGQPIRAPPRLPGAA